MRILLVTSFFPPLHRAGTENYTYSIARGLLKAGHAVQVVCAGRWGEGKHYWNGHSDEIYNDVPVRRYHLDWKKAPDPNRYLYDNPVVAAQFADYLCELRPDIVHITSCLTLSASVIQKAKEANIPIVITLTDFWFLCPRVNLLRSDGDLCDGRTTAAECLQCMLREAKVYRFPSRVLPPASVEHLLTEVSLHPQLTRWRGLRGMAMDMAQRKAFLRKSLAMADYVIAPSTAIRDVFLQNNAALNSRMLPYGHDLAWLDSFVGQTPSARIRIGYIGQIIAIKGVHVLIHAFAKLAKSAGAALSIFGDLNKDPIYTQQLRQTASGHPNIHFNGAFEHEHLGDIFAQLDVLVVPSLWFENNPLVIQEAFAARIPVIATRLGGMSEFVKHEVSGLLFERGNVDDLASQLQRVMVEPDLLGQLQAGIPPVRRIEEEISELAQIYEGLVNHAGSKEIRM